MGDGPGAGGALSLCRESESMGILTRGEISKKEGGFGGSPPFTGWRGVTGTTTLSGDVGEQMKPAARRHEEPHTAEIVLNARAKA
jgi:hypothetical protein